MRKMYFLVEDTALPKMFVVVVIVLAVDAVVFDVVVVVAIVVDVVIVVSVVVAVVIVNIFLNHVFSTITGTPHIRYYPTFYIYISFND